MRLRVLLAFALAACLMLAVPAGLCSSSGASAITYPSEASRPTLPALTAGGFLPADSQQQEFIHTDADNGLWIYITQTLHIEVSRVKDDSAPLIWYEADIHTAPGEPMRTVFSSPDHPGKKFEYPETIARASQMVLAINDDHFLYRKRNKQTIGIVIRGGKIFSEKTLGSRGFAYPNLDTMAIFPDGSLQVFKSSEMKAKDYLDKGATDVFAFGPILIRDGKINTALMGHYKALNPRCAFGMIAPYHYLGIVVDGRADASEGVDLLWLANRMAALHVTQALNLDGGKTTAMVFMGEKLNSVGNYGTDKNMRSLGAMFGFGTSSKICMGE